MPNAGGFLELIDEKPIFSRRITRTCENKSVALLAANFNFVYTVLGSCLFTHVPPGKLPTYATGGIQLFLAPKSERPTSKFGYPRRTEAAQACVLCVRKWECSLTIAECEKGRRKFDTDFDLQEDFLDDHRETSHLRVFNLNKNNLMGEQWARQLHFAIVYNTLDTITFGLSMCSQRTGSGFNIPSGVRSGLGKCHYIDSTFHFIYPSIMSPLLPRSLPATTLTQNSLKSVLVQIFWTGLTYREISKYTYTANSISWMWYDCGVLHLTLVFKISPPSVMIQSWLCSDRFTSTLKPSKQYLENILILHA